MASDSIPLPRLDPVRTRVAGWLLLALAPQASPPAGNGWTPANLKAFFLPRQPVGSIQTFAIPEAFGSVRKRVALPGGVAWLTQGDDPVCALLRNGFLQALLAHEPEDSGVAGDQFWFLAKDKGNECHRKLGEQDFGPVRAIRTGPSGSLVFRAERGFGCLDGIDAPTPGRIDVFTCAEASRDVLMTRDGHFFFLNGRNTLLAAFPIRP